MSLSSFVLLIRRCSYTFTGLTFMQGCHSLDQTVLFTVNGSRQALSFWEDDNKNDLRLWCYQNFYIHAFGWCFKFTSLFKYFLSIYSECDYDLKRVSSDTRVSK